MKLHICFNFQLYILHQKICFVVFQEKPQLRNSIIMLCLLCIICPPFVHVPDISSTPSGWKLPFLKSFMSYHFWWLISEESQIQIFIIFLLFWRIQSNCIPRWVNTSFFNKCTVSLWKNNQFVLRDVLLRWKRPFNWFTTIRACFDSMSAYFLAGATT